MTPSAPGVPDLDQHTLDNGLRVVLQRDATVPLVGIALYYDVGSRNEVPGQSGFAHLFEHLMFQGSANVGKAEHFKLVQQWGGTTNASTSPDRTNYYELLPSHQVDLGLWLEADRMRALAVTEENFENQRQTVMEERRQRVDDAPYGQASVRMGELSFSSWAYAHPVIGSWEDLHAARHADVVAFHQRWYRPDNAVLTVVGDIDVARTLDRIEAWFGDIPRGAPRPVPDVAEPPRQAAVKESMTDPLARLPAVFVNHQCPGFGHDDFYALEVIETLLFRGASGRLHRRLVVDAGIAVQIGGGFDARRGPGVFSMSAAVADGGDLDEVVRRYQAELNALAAAPLPPDVLARVCTQVAAALILGQESVLSRAMQYGRTALFHDDPLWTARYIERLSAVTPAAVQRAAERWFSGSTRVQLSVAPA